MKNISARVAQARARQLLELIKTLGRRNSLRDPLAHSVEEMGFTPPQMHALLWVGGDGPLMMGEIARRVGVTEKTITGIVDRLEARGLVQRERDAQDRRVVRVRATAEGLRTHDEMAAQVQARMAEFMSFLPDEDSAALVGIVQRLVARLESGDAATNARKKVEE